jgi:uncharacterized protein (DUF488 family)
MSSAPIYTIGFTQKTAAEFFGLLRESGAKRIVDVRLNNVSQLAGFAKREDLPYFARELCGMDYVHLPELAPTQPMIDAYRRDRKTWPAFARKFRALLKQREVERTVPREVIHGGCLLCSEHQPHICHRSLVAEYLGEKWGGQVTVKHLT